MREQLIHFSDSPLTAVRSVEQLVLDQDGAWFKPQGLWVSVEGNDDGWRSWCDGEGFSLPRLARQTEIILADDANIVRISTPEGIDGFTEKYGRGSPPYLSQRYGYIVDWPALAKQYDGIIIAPYCWERRLTPSTFWYYPWDCASGCIWNAKAVKELRALPSELDRPAI